MRITSGNARNGHRAAQVGVAVTSDQPKAGITLAANGRELASLSRDLAPSKPLVERIDLPHGVALTDLRLCVTDRARRNLITYQPKPRLRVKIPLSATEPPAPAEIVSADELFLTGLHLEQYRHATRCPTVYWREALRRDPLDSRCNNAVGLWHLHRGEFAQAEKYFRRSIERLTRRNPNPHDGEPFYNLGLCLRYQLGASPNSKSEISSLKLEDAYVAFYKATWNEAWAAAGFLTLAELDCKKSDWPTALEHLDHSQRFNTDNLRARNLKAMVLRLLGREGDANSLLHETLALDPLDWWARWLLGEKVSCDAQTRLDLAYDFAGAGFDAEAISLLKNASVERRDLPDQNCGAAPLVFYTLGWLHEKLGDKKSAHEFYEQAAAESPDYCFPSRLEEIWVLESAMRANPCDARAPYYLGNLFYDRRRHKEAIRLWERSAKLNPNFSIVWRNLGIGYFNISKKLAKASAAYDKAFKANPADARLLFERDQLWKRLGESPEKRLRELEKLTQLVAQRDDLSVELSALYNQTGQHAKALVIVSTRKFQPWEGGEGQVLGQHVRTHLALGREALAQNNFSQAQKHFESALTSPENLGEAKHLLANQSDIRYWLGVALNSLGEKKSAREHWLAAANFKGDFQEMNSRAFSEMTYYSALSWGRLGRKAQATKLLRALLAYARKLQKAEAKIDYFATSLPTMLLFDDDLRFRQETRALFLQAQACLGLGRKPRAKSLLATVLRRDPNHPMAADLTKELSE